MTIVETGYDTVAAAYHDFIADRPSHKITLVRQLLPNLPKDATVLGLGCSSGVPVTSMLSANVHVTGVDISAEQIKLASKHVPSAEFLVGDMMALQFTKA